MILSVVFSLQWPACRHFELSQKNFPAWRIISQARHFARFSLHKLAQLQHHGISTFLKLTLLIERMARKRLRIHTVTMITSQEKLQQERNHLIAIACNGINFNTITAIITLDKSHSSTPKVDFSAANLNYYYQNYNKGTLRECR